jgi:translocation and assembly module TamB
VDVLLAGTGAVSARLSRAEGGAVAIQSLVADFPNLDVTASGDANAVTFQASLTDAALLAPAFPGAVSATGTGELRPGGVTVEADVAGPGGLRPACPVPWAPRRT